MRTLITNGLVVTAAGSYPADVLVDGETIALLGADLAGAGVTADETIDATGKYVVPGGIDVPPTWSCPSAARSRRTPSRAARRRLPTAAPRRSSTSRQQTKGRPLREGLDAWRAKAEGHTASTTAFT